MTNNIAIFTWIILWFFMDCFDMNLYGEKKNGDEEHRVVYTGEWKCLSNENEGGGEGA